MPNIFTPQQDEQFITPFSPVIGYKKLSPSFVEKLNNSMNDKLEDWSDNLVGKVKQELKFDDDIINFFIEEMKDFIMRYQLNTEVYTSMGRSGLDPNSNYGISTTSGWFIRQFEGEYNPVHVHPESMVSCVGYLKLPEGIEDEWEEDYNVECGHDNEYSLEEIEAKDEDDEENIFFTEGHIVKRDMQNGKIEDIAFACDSAYANEIAKALNKILDEE